jgi:hypothetical protein
VIVHSLRPYLICSESVTDPPPNETIRGIYIDAHGEQEEQEVLETVNRLKNLGGEDKDDDDDDDDDDQTSVFLT